MYNLIEGRKNLFSMIVGGILHRLQLFLRNKVDRNDVIFNDLSKKRNVNNFRLKYGN